LAYGRVDLQGTSSVSGIVHAEATIPPFSTTRAIGHSQINTGWVVGYGVEGKLLIPGWTYRIESLYMDLGTLDDNDPLPLTSSAVLGGGHTTTHTHFTDGILRAGLNYQFH
jgi:opacity protein-like surface antigen